MKQSLFPLAALGVLAGIAAAKTIQGVYITAPDQQMHGIIIGLADQAKVDAKLWKGEDFVPAQLALANLPDPLTMRQRLQRAVTDLEQRGAAAKLKVDAVDRFHARYVDAMLDRYLGDLGTVAQRRQPTREQFQYLSDLLTERAEVAKEPTDLRQRLADACLALEERARAAFQTGGDVTTFETALSGFQDLTYQSRYQSALDWLVREANQREATREDFLHAKDILADRARMALNEDVAGVLSGMERQLAALLDRYEGGDIPRDELAAMREQAVARAREAAASL